MPKKRLTGAEVAKISTRTNVIITGIVTLLVAIISFIWRPIFLQKWTSTLASTVSPITSSHDWYVIFELKFRANYWTEGVHSFIFDAECPLGIKATSENGPTNPFSIDRTAEIQNSTVFIRRRGLYLTEINGDAFGHVIHPSQETAAVYSLSTVSFEDAKRLQDECKVRMQIDDGSFMELTDTHIDKLP